MLSIEYTGKFKRDFKLAKKQGLDLNKLENVVSQIENQRELDYKLKDHELTGNWRGYRELHLAFDWILIYKLEPEQNKVIFVRTGSHSTLFKK